MILLWLIIMPFAGGIFAWALSRWGSSWSRWVSLAAMAGDLVLALILWTQYYAQFGFTASGPWLVQFNRPWIPALGINFHLAIDSLSLLLIVLTAFLGILSVACSWTEIQTRVGFFHFNLLWVLAGLIGVFSALDLFLFYFFWEMMLVPMYFLIVIWGHERRVYASVKFFIFTQLSGLLMLLAILGLYFIHGRNTGVYTFDYPQLLGTALPSSAAMWLMLGFLIAFAVKLPVVPVHTWLPDAHTEAPTAGSVVLAGLLLKTGAYGLLRFVVPLFPQAALDFRPVAMALAVIGILYGALMAFAQTDLKRLVAYTSISHMGFVLLGVFAWNELALQGAVVQMICHGISTGALFILVGALQERIHTRDVTRMGGLWSTAPRMGGVGLLFALASLGLPGLGNFVGEFLVLIGTYQRSVPMAILATVGLVTATVYSLWMIQVTFHGPNKKGWKLTDFSGREMAIVTAMIAAIVWLGLYPQPVLNTAEQALNNLRFYAPMTRQVAAAKDAQLSPPNFEGGGRDQNTPRRGKGNGYR
jgi:NADH-quinone oxidoreductase subunit M